MEENAPFSHERTFYFYFSSTGHWSYIADEMLVVVNSAYDLIEVDDMEYRDCQDVSFSPLTSFITPL